MKWKAHQAVKCAQKDQKKSLTPSFPIDPLGEVTDLNDESVDERSERQGDENPQSYFVVHIVPVAIALEATLDSAGLFIQ